MARKLKRVVIKEELVALTGKVNDAIVLNQMIYWSERVKDSDQYVQEEIDRARKYADGSTESLEEIKETLESGWIYKKSPEMIDDTMLTISRKTMDRIFESLVDNKWLDRRRNPKYKWDKTWQYRVNLYKIQSDLLKLGYNLEGYSLPDNNSSAEDDLPEGQSDHSRGQHDHSNGHHDQSRGHVVHSEGHHDPAIPEITSEITSQVFEEDEEEDYIINEIDKNIFYKSLMIFLSSKNVTKELTLRIIEECIKQNLYEFRERDYIKQFDHMAKEIEFGVTYGAFEVYFVNGLKDRVEQAFISKEHMEQERQQQQEKLQKRDTSFYYNWLEEDGSLKKK